MPRIPEGELLYGILIINCYMTKDIFDEKPIGGDATNWKLRKFVELISWWHRQNITQDFLPVYSNCVTYEPSNGPCCAQPTVWLTELQAIKDARLNSLIEVWNALSRRQRPRLARKYERLDLPLFPIPRFHVTTEKPRETGTWLLACEHPDSPLSYLTAVLVIWSRVLPTVQWRLLPHSWRCHWLSYHWKTHHKKSRVFSAWDLMVRKLGGDIAESSPLGREISSCAQTHWTQVGPRIYLWSVKTSPQ